MDDTSTPDETSEHTDWEYEGPDDSSIPDSEYRPSETDSDDPEYESRPTLLVVILRFNTHIELLVF